MRYTVSVEYKGGYDTSKDEELRLLARLWSGQFQGSGFAFHDATRDLSFGFTKRADADMMVEALMSNTRRMQVFMYDNKEAMEECCVLQQKT